MSWPGSHSGQQGWSIPPTPHLGVAVHHPDLTSREGGPESTPGVRPCLVHWEGGPGSGLSMATVTVNVC